MASLDDCCVRKFDQGATGDIKTSFNNAIVAKTDAKTAVGAEQAALAKAHFLATMSHEIRTPMSTLLGMLERLEGSDLDHRQQQVLVTVGDAAQMLRQILDDVLHSQRLQALPPQLRPTSVAALVRAVQQLLMPVAASRGLHLRIQLDPEVQAGSLADGLRLRQILFNLAGNALKFTEHGGVDLQVQVLQQHDRGQRLRLQVSDSGVGISPERQQAVFAAYTQAEVSTTRRFGGSGLGLAICRELAQAMQGRIQVESQLGRGTCFGVTLPLPLVVDANAESEGEVHREDAANMPPLRVLLVEDDATVADVVRGLLSARGHEVVHAGHALAALREISAGDFDVGLLDLDLPGLSGFELAQHLRNQGYMLPLLAVTARTDPDLQQQVEAAGIGGFLRKPVTGELLVEAIARVMGR